MDWFLLVLKKFAEFNGRSRRKEYWMFTLVSALICIVLEAIAMVLAKTSMALGFALFALICIYALVLLIPSLAVSVRRLHDSGKSGWLLLVGLVPFLGGLVLLVLMCLDSTSGPNEYGPNPKSAEAIPALG